MKVMAQHANRPNPEKVARGSFEHCVKVHWPLHSCFDLASCQKVGNLIEDVFIRIFGHDIRIMDGAEMVSSKEIAAWPTLDPHSRVRALRLPDDGQPQSLHERRNVQEVRQRREVRDRCQAVRRPERLQSGNHDLKNNIWHPSTDDFF